VSHVPVEIGVVVEVLVVEVLGVAVLGVEDRPGAVDELDVGVEPARGDSVPLAHAEATVTRDTRTKARVTPRRTATRVPFPVTRTAAHRVVARAMP
jgi:hypothetical protein